MNMSERAVIVVLLVGLCTVPADLYASGKAYYRYRAVEKARREAQVAADTMQRLIHAPVEQQECEGPGLLVSMLRPAMIEEVEAYAQSHHEREEDERIEAEIVAWMQGFVGKNVNEYVPFIIVHSADGDAGFYGIKAMIACHKGFKEGQEHGELASATIDKGALKVSNTVDQRKIIVTQNAEGVAAFDAYGFELLVEAIKEGVVEMVQEIVPLLDKKVHTVDQEGHNALYHAVHAYAQRGVFGDARHNIVRLLIHANVGSSALTADGANISEPVKVMLKQEIALHELMPMQGDNQENV